MAVAPGQPAGLSKGMFLYTGADWLKLTCQSEVDEGASKQTEAGWVWYQSWTVCDYCDSLCVPSPIFPFLT